MKRRDFVKNIALSTGLLFLPGTLISFAKKQKIHLVIIGDNDLRYMEQFCKQNSTTSYTSIGWDEKQINDFSIANKKGIEFDFSSITVNHSNPMDNSVSLPKNIKEIFYPNNNYLIICSLYRRNAILSNEIINWLDGKAIDFWFFGSIPLLNPNIAPWAAQVFSKFKNNPRVSIYDINVYANKLRYENGDQLFSEAVVECDDKLVRKLGDFYRKIVL